MTTAYFVFISFFYSYDLEVESAEGIEKEKLHYVFDCFYRPSSLTGVTELSLVFHYTTLSYRDTRNERELRGLCC